MISGVLKKTPNQTVTIKKSASYFLEIASMVLYNSWLRIGFKITWSFISKNPTATPSLLRGFGNNLD